jgi:hypothetical protein
LVVAHWRRSCWCCCNCLIYGTSCTQPCKRHRCWLLLLLRRSWRQRW